MPFSIAFLFLAGDEIGLVGGSCEDSRTGRGVGSLPSVTFSAVAAFAASLAAFFLASRSFGEGKSTFIVSKVKFAIKAYSSVNGSMNSGVLKSLLNAPLITNGQSTQEGTCLAIPDGISMNSFQRLDALNLFRMLISSHSLFGSVSKRSSFFSNRRAFGGGFFSSLPARSFFSSFLDCFSLLSRR